MKLKNCYEMIPYDADIGTWTKSNETLGLFNDIQEIYSKLQDGMSRDLFNSRLAFSITGDFRVMEPALRKYIPSYQTQILQLLPDFLAKNTENVYIFGGGWLCHMAVRHLPDVRFKGVIDNNKGNTGDTVCGLPIMRFEEFMQNEDAKNAHIGIAVSGSSARDSIKKQITDAGFDYEHRCFDFLSINDFINNLVEEQYFTLSALNHDDNEVFVDCGAFDGAGSLEFIKWCEGKYKAIYAFEPDLQQRDLLQSKMGDIENIKLFSCGLGDKEEVIRFSGLHPQGFSIAGGSDDNYFQDVNIKRLDDILSEERPTFIKMDIEGSEYNAITGAKHLIQQYKPKLAICVYHRPDDIITIPKLILSIRDDYKFYLRHCYISSSQTVLFAV